MIESILAMVDAMLKAADLSYYQQRERAERWAATAAKDVSARGVHFELAERYADRVWALEEQERRQRPA